jgi:negative modulator of initiation of replication
LIVEAPVMPLLEIDEDVYQYLLQRAVRIGEDGSSILRRELNLPDPAEDQDEGTSSTPAEPDHKDALTAFISSPQMLRYRTVTRKFLLLLSFLAKEHGSDFERVFTVRGRRRVYFAKTRDEIATSGTSLHPQQIPGTPYWAMTNADSRQKWQIVFEVMRVLGYPDELARHASDAL